MGSILSIYKKLIIKEVTCERGDDFVIMNCDLVLNNQMISSIIMISHTDFNRIMAKIAILGYDFNTENISVMTFDDGTEIMDYKFDKIIGEKFVLEDFEFKNRVKEIRA